MSSSHTSNWYDFLTDHIPSAAYTIAGVMLILAVAIVTLWVVLG